PKKANDPGGGTRPGRCQSPGVKMPLIGLAAQESRNLQLIVVHVGCNRSGPAVGIQALRSRPRSRRALGVFRYRLLRTRLKTARILWTIRRERRQALPHDRATGRPRRLLPGRRLLVLPGAAQA